MRGLLLVLTLLGREAGETVVVPSERIALMADIYDRRAGHIVNDSDGGPRVVGTQLMVEGAGEVNVRESITEILNQINEGLKGA